MDFILVLDNDVMGIKYAYIIGYVIILLLAPNGLLATSSEADAKNIQLNDNPGRGDNAKSRGYVVYFATPANMTGGNMTSEVITAPPRELTMMGGGELNQETTNRVF